MSSNKTTKLLILAIFCVFTSINTVPRQSQPNQYLVSESQISRELGNNSTYHYILSRIKQIYDQLAYIQSQISSDQTLVSVSTLNIINDCNENLEKISKDINGTTISHDSKIKLQTKVQEAITLGNNTKSLLAGYSIEPQKTENLERTRVATSDVSELNTGSGGVDGDGGVGVGGEGGAGVEVGSGGDARVRRGAGGGAGGRAGSRGDGAERVVVDDVRVVVVDNEDGARVGAGGEDGAGVRRVAAGGGGGAGVEVGDRGGARGGVGGTGGSGVVGTVKVDDEGSAEEEVNNSTVTSTSSTDTSPMALGKLLDVGKKANDARVTAAAGSGGREGAGGGPRGAGSGSGSRGGAGSGGGTVVPSGAGGRGGSRGGAGSGGGAGVAGDEGTETTVVRGELDRASFTDQRKKDRDNDAMLDDIFRSDNGGGGSDVERVVVDGARGAGGVGGGGDLLGRAGDAAGGAGGEGDLWRGVGGEGGTVVPSGVGDVGDSRGGAGAAGSGAGGVGGFADDDYDDGKPLPSNPIAGNTGGASVVVNGGTAAGDDVRIEEGVGTETANRHNGNDWGIEGTEEANDEDAGVIRVGDGDNVRTGEEGGDDGVVIGSEDLMSPVILDDPEALGGEKSTSSWPDVPAQKKKSRTDGWKAQIFGVDDQIIDMIQGTLSLTSKTQGITSVIDSYPGAKPAAKSIANAIVKLKASEFVKALDEKLLLQALRDTASSEITKKRKTANGSSKISDKEIDDQIKARFTLQTEESQLTLIARVAITLARFIQTNSKIVKDEKIRGQLMSSTNSNAAGASVVAVGTSTAAAKAPAVLVDPSLAAAVSKTQPAKKRSTSRSASSSLSGLGSLSGSASSGSSRSSRSSSSGSSGSSRVRLVASSSGSSDDE